MQTKVTFRHAKSSPELIEAAEEAASKFERFYDGIISTETIFIADSALVVEFTVRIQGGTLVAKEASDDFEKSLHAATDKMIRMLRKQKDKLFRQSQNGREVLVF